MMATICNKKFEKALEYVIENERIMFLIKMILEMKPNSDSRKKKKKA